MSWFNVSCYADYKNDPYSEGSPLNAICSRGDLMQPPAGFGCIDTKVSQATLDKEHYNGYMLFTHVHNIGN